MELVCISYKVEVVWIDNEPKLSLSSNMKYGTPNTKFNRYPLSISGAEACGLTGTPHYTYIL
jgi:hypothetical protein